MRLVTVKKIKMSDATRLSFNFLKLSLQKRRNITAAKHSRWSCHATKLWLHGCSFIGRGTLSGRQIQTPKLRIYGGPWKENRTTSAEIQNKIWIAPLTVGYKISSAKRIPRYVKIQTLTQFIRNSAHHVQVNFHTIS